MYKRQVLKSERQAQGVSKQDSIALFGQHMFWYSGHVHLTKMAVFHVFINANVDAMLYSADIHFPARGQHCPYPTWASEYLASFASHRCYWQENSVTTSETSWCGPSHSLQSPSGKNAVPTTGCSSDNSGWKSLRSFNKSKRITPVSLINNYWFSFLDKSSNKRWNFIMTLGIKTRKVVVYNLMPIKFI